jgi:phenylacetate-CoA ligase
LERGDIIQVSYGYGLFTGGLGLHYGAEHIGASVLPMSTGNTERQVELMRDMGVTAIACTPSYLLHISETAKRMGVSIKDDTRLKVGVLGAEPWSETMRGRIEDELGIKAYDIYGTSELSGPMFTECREQMGLHVWGDQMLIEIIDPDTGEPLEDEEEGELVVTTLQKEALPLLRYRTRDITRIERGICECGRTHPRIMRILGRTDDMLIIRGINVFPSQIEHVLMSIGGVGDHFQIVVDREEELDRMLVRVEVSEELFSDKIRDLISLKNSVKDRLRTSLNLNVEVELVGPGALPRFEGKARRVIDKRRL